MMFLFDAVGIFAIGLLLILWKHHRRRHREVQWFVGRVTEHDRTDRIAVYTCVDCRTVRRVRHFVGQCCPAPRSFLCGTSGCDGRMMLDPKSLLARVDLVQQ